MKKLCIILALLLLLSSCAAGGEITDESKDSESIAASEAESTASEDESAAETSATESSDESNVSDETSEDDTKDLKKIPVPADAHVVSNLDFANNGKKMGDNDGPAYCVYSKVGYNKASMDILFSQMKINNIRQSDGNNVNDYIFLGCDIYSSGNYWINCFDCGFCYSGKNAAWHLFYNIYKAADEKASTWYESKIKLDMTHDYRLILDTSEADEKASVTIYDITTDKVVDSASFGVKSIKADGRNSSYLMDFAIDYPGNIKKDTQGNNSDDWVEITLYNTDEDIYINNILVENVKIYKAGLELDWTSAETDHRGFWPDKTMTKIDYAVTKVIGSEDDYDTSFRVDLDMNRG